MIVVLAYLAFGVLIAGLAGFESAEEVAVCALIWPVAIIYALGRMMGGDL